jgi:ubiquinone/menaquinone biosynthesis C-methylase UbiE
MGFAGAKLFSFLQGAGFYRELHSTVVAKIPEGKGGLWLDVGCGPGLLARLASRRGYRAVGIDIDRHMVKAAEKAVLQERGTATFLTGDLEIIGNEKAAVVSASSLLAVVADPQEFLNKLWERVIPGGRLVIIEPTEKMTLKNAWRIVRNGLPGGRSAMLLLWAFARQGGAVDKNIFRQLKTAGTTETPLLNGLASAWIFRKPSA